MDVLESLDHDLDGDQEDGLIATNCNPDVVGRAERAFHGAGDDDANPINLTSSTETQIPQQISREPRQPESINSANRETLGPVPSGTTSEPFTSAHQLIRTYDCKPHRGNRKGNSHQR